MKQICKTLGTITLVIGAIGSLSLAYIAGAPLSISRFGDLERVRNWPLSIICFLACFFCVAVLSAILHGIAEVLEYLESIDQVQDDLIQSTKPDTEEELPKNYWKCPTCRKNNPPYTGTCSCGQSKP